jgi:preprotein translocase subunit Sss1
MNPEPKKENENVGFKYHVTMEQIKEHQKKTTEEILEWIEEYARFLHEFQTPEDKERMRILKNKKTSWD